MYICIVICRYTSTWDISSQTTHSPPYFPRPFFHAHACGWSRRQRFATRHARTSRDVLQLSVGWGQTNTRTSVSELKWVCNGKCYLNLNTPCMLPKLHQDKETRTSTPLLRNIDQSTSSHWARCWANRPPMRTGWDETMFYLTLDLA